MRLLKRMMTLILVIVGILFFFNAPLSPLGTLIRILLLFWFVWWLGDVLGDNAPSVTRHEATIDSLNQGSQKLDNQDFEGAVADFTKVLEYLPTTDGYFLRGTAHLNLKSYQRAVEDFSEAIQLTPPAKSIAQYCLSRATARINLGEFCEAIEDCEEILRENFRHGEAYRLRGIARTYSEDHEGAISDFIQVTRLLPYPNAYYDLGALYWFMEMYQDALPVLNRLIERNPESSSAFYLRGNLYYELGKELEAFEDFEAGITLERNGKSDLYEQDEHGYLARGLAMYRLDSLESAIADLHQAVEISRRNHNRPFYKKAIQQLRAIQDDTAN